MKWYFKIFAIIAAVALLPLQYFLLSNMYKSLEDNLFVKVDESFRSAVEEEAMARFNSLEQISDIRLGQSGARFNQDVLMSVSSILEMAGSRPNKERISELFAMNLEERELHNLTFKVVETKNDTSYYRTADDFLTDGTFEKQSFSALSTHIVPTSADLSIGIKAVVNNPYKAIMAKMKMLVIFSIVIALFVLYSLYKFAKTLNRVTFINNLRKDHTYAMIHDIKTPLSSIMIIAEDFKDNEAIVSNPDTAEQLKILDEECNHLNQICDKVINVAKVENRKLKFVYEKIDLEEFLGGITAKYKALYSGSAEKTVTFETDCSQERMLISDRLYLTEIMDNLIYDSIKYSQKSVHISIKSVAKRGITELRVKDHVIGFSDKAKKRLFKKFERGENTVGISGHGIGLNYVYQLMKFFGGYVRIEGKAGLYTEVFLGFPAKCEYEEEN